MSISPKWNDQRLLVSSDTAHRARYRLLQSWYRENVLGLPPGLDSQGILRANILPVDAVAANSSLNFLTAEIGDYVDKRAQLVLEQGGSLEVDRLRRNLLSSMPMCFNIFGHFRAHPISAAKVLSKVYGLDIAFIDEMEVEWKPEGIHPLGDRTAFDAFIRYHTSSGLHGFVGIETKYTEPFSATEYDRPSYYEYTEAAYSCFIPGASKVLKGRATNQIWRNALLAVAVRQECKYDLGHVGVLAIGSDKTARIAVTGLSEQLVSPYELIVNASLGSLVATAKQEPELAEWAVEFDRRYLDWAQTG